MAFQPWGPEEQARFLANLLGAVIELRPFGTEGGREIHIRADLERGRMFAGDAYGLIFGGWSDAAAALQFEWQRQAFEIAKDWKEGQKLRLWGWSGVHGAPSWREVTLGTHHDKSRKALGICEFGRPCGAVEAYRLAPLEPAKAPPGFEVFQTPSGRWAWERTDGNAGCGVGYADRDSAVAAAAIRWREG